MNITAHPAEELLLGYAAGTLDPGEQIALATHVLACSQCRGFAGAMELAGGALLGELAGDAMSADAPERIAARLDDPAPALPPAPPPQAALRELDGLPTFVRRLPAEPWRWVAPGLKIQRLKPAAASPTRVFLLKAKPGIRLLPHGHQDTELTCVLTGSFSHDGQRYGPGDFDCGDSAGEHEIVIGSEAPCISLVAMRGRLTLRGPLGRLIQPLIAI
jgi:putative transcriptional regulator